jgi:DMSO/TMAO reductase YedYZ molybdopterin-dependent catalytic subunit
MKALPFLLFLALTVSAQETIAVRGSVAHPLTLTRADLAAMPREKATVTDPHSKATRAFEGVLLSEILGKAGVPLGEHLRGKALAVYVLVEATDGYRVVYAIAELDPATSGQRVLLADTMDGKPLSSDDGPFRMIAPGDKRPARWVRMVKSLTVVAARE